MCVYTRMLGTFCGIRLFPVCCLQMSDPRSLSDRHDWIFTFRYKALMILSFSPLLWDAAVIDVRIFLIKRRDKKIDFTAVEKLVSWKMSGFTLMPLTSAWKVNRKGTISTIYLRLKWKEKREKQVPGVRSRAAALTPLNSPYEKRRWVFFVILVFKGRGRWGWILWRFAGALFLPEAYKHIMVTVS